METFKNVFIHPTLRWMDHTNKVILEHSHHPAMQAFALDDALALSVSEEASPPIFRFWNTDRVIVLGIPDTRLPFLEEGVQFLKENGYDVIVRNSGGLAVPLTRNVLNLSIIIPNGRKISIHDGYEAMFLLIKESLKDLTKDIKAYEIVGSFCPGDYDLSINGIKFAGISQRRVKNGVAVQIYIDVSESSFERSELIQNFYRISIKGEKTPFKYPTIDPEKMNSLTNLLQEPITLEQMKQRIFQTVQAFTREIVQINFTDQELESYEKRYEQMVKRNETLQDLL